MKKHGCCIRHRRNMQVQKLHNYKIPGDGENTDINLLDEALRTKVKELKMLIRANTGYSRELAR